MGHPSTAATTAATAAAHAALICVFLLAARHVEKASAIGCFVCSSVNSSEPDCEDVFNNTGRFYHHNCEWVKLGHQGLFPATHCIKVKATNPATGVSLVVRQCAVDTGGINSEMEIGRESHCSLVNMIKFNDIAMNGCSLTCDTDGCNAAPRTPARPLLAGLCVALAVMLSSVAPI